MKTSSSSLIQVLIKLLWEATDAAGCLHEVQGLQSESGGEDLPDAFRSIPVPPEDLNTNVVAVRHPLTHEFYYQISYAYYLDSAQRSCNLLAGPAS